MATYDLSDGERSSPPQSACAQLVTQLCFPRRVFYVRFRVMIFAGSIGVLFCFVLSQGCTAQLSKLFVLGWIIFPASSLISIKTLRGSSHSAMLFGSFSGVVCGMYLISCAIFN